MNSEQHYSKALTLSSTSEPSFAPGQSVPGLITISPPLVHLILLHNIDTLISWTKSRIPPICNIKRTFGYSAIEMVRDMIDNLPSNEGLQLKWSVERKITNSYTNNVWGIVCQKHPDSKVHGANRGPTWVLSAPDGPHVGPINLAIRASIKAWDK